MLDLQAHKFEIEVIFQEVAEAANIDDPAAFAAEAVRRLAQDYAGEVFKIPVRPDRRQSLAARNERIFAMYQDGMPVYQIARRFELTRSRVSQIVWERKREIRDANAIAGKTARRRRPKNDV